MVGEKQKRKTPDCRLRSGHWRRQWVKMLLSDSYFSNLSIAVDAVTDTKLVK